MNTKIVNRKSKKSLKVSDHALIKQAIKALKLSYSPYSKFAVGAAILKSDGNTYLGANIENASYPLCLCAERVAIAHAHASASKAKIISIAIVCKSATHDLNQPVSPCGACRQVISEFENFQRTPIKIILSDLAGHNVLIFDTVKDLLPYSFDSKFLL